MKRWNLTAIVLALLLVFALGKLYRPYLGVRVGAVADLALFAVAFLGCRFALRKVAEGLEE